MSAIGSWLNDKEPIIRNSFRCLVVALLVLIAFRVEESISTADFAHDRAYDARDFATMAAHDANKAAVSASEAASTCRQILYR